ncbi:MAG: YegS/Rv2252/BmrU family lipid kinase [Tissierellia bacterium]|nr:YegS/Rv2252/BmrU family lipid kinase [Tissierellia bacterium]
MDEKKDYLLIKNPIAGSAKNRRWIDTLMQELDKRGLSYDLVETQEPQHAIKLAYDAAASYGVVVAVGGDGTVNEVGRGLLQRGEGVLGILPVGNGNDFYRNFEEKANPEEAIQKLINGKFKKVNVGQDHEGRYVLNIASVGLDAFTGKTQKKIKKYVPKTMGYVVALIYSMFFYRKQKITVRLDGREFKSSNILLCFGTGKTYGGGIKIMPWAQMDDGYFNIVNIIDMSNLMLFIVAPSIIFGLHTKIKKYVKVYKAKEVEILGEDLTLNLDGELFDVEKVHFKLLFEKLKVIC